MTLHTLAVLTVFINQPGQHYGLEIVERTGLASGALYPILARLEQHGLLQSTWEQIDPRGEGRPPRRYYTLTEQGTKRAREAVASARLAITPAEHPST
jgi:PadR family transcriptional regulator PadR